MEVIVLIFYHTKLNMVTVKLIFGGYYIWRFFKYDNFMIWQRINLPISNTGIQGLQCFIWRQLMFEFFLNLTISPNKSSPIINCFTVCFMYRVDSQVSENARSFGIVDCHAHTTQYAI